MQSVIDGCIKNKEVVMAELFCSAGKCTYNKDNYCCKGDIMVGGKFADTSDGTSCDSFHARKGDVYTSSVSHPSKTISIDCEAIKCVYNDNYRCQASHVDIKGNAACSSSETVCATFEEKV